VIIEMTDLEAIEILYNLAIRQMRGPVTDQELDAIFYVRALLARKNQIRDQSGQDARDKGQWR
jgi:hypothetical protein